MANKKLSKNFSLAEMVKSSTADRLDIDNWTTDNKIIKNLELVAQNILQPVRDYYGVPFAPNSGYRCLKLNRAIKSSDTSDHVRGKAVDFEVPGIPNKELAEWIKDNLNFNQLILEFVYKDIPKSGWVHCSYVSPDANRNQILTITNRGVEVGLILKNK